MSAKRPRDGQPMTPEEQKLQRKLRDTRSQRDRATGRVRELRDYCAKYQRQIVALQAQLRQQTEKAKHDKAPQS